MSFPDWQNSNEYLFTEALDQQPSRAGWAWEFLRRNGEYQSDLTAWNNGEFDQVEYVPPRLPDETFRQWQVRCTDDDVDPLVLRPEGSLARRWHLSRRVWDYQLSAAEHDANEDSVEFEFPTFPRLIVSWDSLERLPVQVKGGEDGGGDYEVRVSDEIAVVVFDMRKPISPQWKRINKRLVKRQQEWVKEKNGLKSPSPKKNSWREYLRVLDAKSQSNLKNTEIAKVIYGDQEYNPTAPAKTMDDHLNSARRMVSEGYRSIPVF